MGRVTVAIESLEGLHLDLGGYRRRGRKLRLGLCLRGIVLHVGQRELELLGLIPGLWLPRLLHTQAAAGVGPAVSAGGATVIGSSMLPSTRHRSPSVGVVLIFFCLRAIGDIPKFAAVLQLAV